MASGAALSADAGSRSIFSSSPWFFFLFSFFAIDAAADCPG
jgi:hypothetical protein